MQKYGVIKTVGNETTVLEVCNSKEGAFIAKHRYRDAYKGQDVQIDAIKGEFDDDGKLVYNKYTLLYEL